MYPFQKLVLFKFIVFIYLPSNRTTFESPINAMPTDNLLFYPPDKFLDNSLVFSVRSKSSIIFFTYSARSLGLTPLFYNIYFINYKPLKALNRNKCSSTVRLSKRISCYGQTPIKCRISSI